MTFVGFLITLSVAFFGVAVWASLRIYQSEEDRMREHEERMRAAAEFEERGGDENL